MASNNLSFVLLGILDNSFKCRTVSKTGVFYRQRGTKRIQEMAWQQVGHKALVNSYPRGVKHVNEICKTRGHEEFQHLWEIEGHEIFLIFLIEAMKHFQLF